MNQRSPQPTSQDYVRAIWKMFEIMNGQRPYWQDEVSQTIKTIHEGRQSYRDAIRDLFGCIFCPHNAHKVSCILRAIFSDLGVGGMARATIASGVIDETTAGQDHWSRICLNALWGIIDYDPETKVPPEQIDEFWRDLTPELRLRIFAEGGLEPFECLAYSSTRLRTMVLVDAATAQAFLNHACEGYHMKLVSRLLSDAPVGWLDTAACEVMLISMCLQPDKFTAYQCDKIAIDLGAYLERCAACTCAALRASLLLEGIRARKDDDPAICMATVARDSYLMRYIARLVIGRGDIEVP